MHDLAFADAARPTPAVVLKLPLRQYSLGHELLLLQRRNALLLLAQEDFNQLPASQQQSALIEAVWICADPYSVSDKLSLPSFLAWRIRWRNFKVRLWHRRFNEGDYPLAIAEFRNYLAAGRSLPPTPDPLDSAIAAGEAAPESGGRALGSPLLAGLINFCSSRVESREPRAGASLLALDPRRSTLDLPYAYAGWLYFAEMESQGRFKIENQKEFEVRLEVAQAKAEALAEEVSEEVSGAKGQVSGEENLPNLTPDTSHPAHSPGLATPPPDLTPDTSHLTPEDTNA